MASVSYHISNLLEKMTSNDKDFRFMATNDLMTELQKDSIKLDDDSEKKVVRMLLKLLEDKNGEVQNLAVKCLGPLVSKVKEFQVETIVDTLCSNMLSDKEQLRDISSIGLKTVINELPPASSPLAANICKRITGRLTSAISKQEDVSVKLEALDILGDLLSRFGGLLLNFHASILEALLPQLTSARMAVRKRAILALGQLVMSCCASLFQKLMDHLLEQLTNNTNVSYTRTFIQCIGAICRHAGHRIGQHLERILPLTISFSKVEGDDELREYCIQAFESFVRRCPKEVSPHILTIIELCLEYLCYDPNYNYDDADEDDDENAMDADNLDDDDEGESDDEYSDDDDMSWKVRRASAKCLQATMGTRHEMLSDFYRTVSPALVARFKEREENVKSDIFQAFITLLKQTRPTHTAFVDPDAMDQEEGPVSMLRQQIPDIVKAVHRQMKEKSIKTRQGCFALLTELIHVVPGSLNNHIAALVPGVQFSLGDKNSSSNMKIDTLAFLNCLMCNHTPHVFHSHIKVLISHVVSAVGDPFYKITSEALLVTQTMIQVIRPLDCEVSFDFTPYVMDLYSCTLTRLRAADIDQEVKERAISCMSQIIANLGDHLTSELSVCLPIFLERLKNEITRLTTVKALTLIASSPLKLDISSILNNGMPILASFLRKNHRALKLSTLACLNILIINYGEHVTETMINGVLIEMPPLISETDLHISQLSLTLLTSLARILPKSMLKIKPDILMQILNLIRSPLLQGGALDAMLEFFKTLVSTSTPGMTYADLLRCLTEPVYNPTEATQPPSAQYAVHKQAFHSVAKCVAVLTINTASESAGVITQFINDIKNPKSSDSVKLFALLSIGEIGKHVDMSKQTGLQTVLINCFSLPSEEVKSAASFALGNVSVGNLPLYLPFVLQEIESQPKRQYLLLHSLKEIITCQSKSSVTGLQEYVASIWAMLFKHCECPEEGTRNVVAECLGKLTLIDPVTLLPKLKDFLTSPSAFTRSTVVTAVKYTISDQPQPIDPLLKSCIGDFLKTMEDTDLNVRRVSLVTFNSAAHNKPSLVRDLLDEILPNLYNETNVRKELIREVEMGPFKHTVDDGLDIRKAAFECMYTLLDSCLNRVDIFEFLNHVEEGLKDHYDIKMLTYLMLVRLSSLCPHAMLQRLDRLIEPLRTTCTTKVKANSVKQEFEKQDELKRSAMRAVVALLAMPDSDKNPMLNEFVTQIRGSPEMSTIFDGIQKDNSGPGGDTFMDTS